MDIKGIFELLRVKHYLKNLFIFAPLFFSSTFNTEDILIVSIGFCLFSLTASSIYILNDLNDIDYDKCHPQKKFRPIPSEKISKLLAKRISIFLTTITLFLALYINLNFFIILFTYYLINLAYTFKLKDLPVIDIIIISFGFVLRLLAGSSLVSIELSTWIILITFLLALFLALGKRRDEYLLLKKGQKIRKNISFYSLKKIDFALKFIAFLIVVSYVFFTISPITVNKFGENIIYSTFFVIAGFLRYYYYVFVKKYYSDPTEILTNDLTLQAIIIFWIFSYYFILI